MNDKENEIIDPHRDEWLIEEQTHDWIKAATAAILLISAIAALLKHSTDDENWRY